MCSSRGTSTGWRPRTPPRRRPASRFPLCFQISLPLAVPGPLIAKELAGAPATLTAVYRLYGVHRPTFPRWASASGEPASRTIPFRGTSRTHSTLFGRSGYRRGLAPTRQQEPCRYPASGVLRQTWPSIPTGYSVLLRLHSAKPATRYPCPLRGKENDQGKPCLLAATETAIRCR